MIKKKREGGRNEEEKSIIKLRSR